MCSVGLGRGKVGLDGLMLNRDITFILTYLVSPLIVKPVLIREFYHLIGLGRVPFSEVIHLAIILVHFMEQTERESTTRRQKPFIRP